MLHPAKRTRRAAIAVTLAAAMATGAVSHGCIRLSRDGIDAVNGLPVGTPVEITP